MQALSEINGSTYHKIKFPVPSVIFFGAPHKGLQTAALEELVKSEPSEILVRELKAESPTLIDLNVSFSHLPDRTKILTLFEMLEQNCD